MRAGKSLSLSSADLGRLKAILRLEISVFDEAYRTASEDAHVVGLRTRQIVDLESGGAKVKFLCHLLFMFVKIQ